ncbi:hypothetical protein [Bacillus alkalicellulosilyticus]|uniref:hypothetical protein n=1 Tax=Alkalihalobacterium alkalicellulosilyticum TaxID=1912214 RepID=UPI0009963770|nr:hypothetical protein [Bacillus alkalicellulosilyticus]
MKKMVRSYWVTILIFVLFGWALVNFNHVFSEFAHVVTTGQEGFDLSLNVMPIFILFLVAITLAVPTYLYRRRRRKESWKSIIVIPEEFLDDDEREAYITAKACQKAYLSMHFVVPAFAAITAIVYPFFTETVPYLPIIFILLIAIVQITVFHVSVRQQIKA